MRTRRSHYTPGRKRARDDLKLKPRSLSGAGEGLDAAATPNVDTRETAGNDSLFYHESAQTLSRGVPGPGSRTRSGSAERKEPICDLPPGLAGQSEAMSAGSGGVRRGSLAAREVKSEACSGCADTLIKALGPRLRPQRSAALAHAPCHLGRAAA